MNAKARIYAGFAGFNTSSLDQAVESWKYAIAPCRKGFAPGFLMRAAVSLITAIAFVLHLLLGCCGHHAHASEAVATTAGCDCSHHCHDTGSASHEHDIPHGSESDPGEHDCPGKRCDGPECAFAVSAKVSLSKAWFSCANLLAMLAPVPAVEPQLLSHINLGDKLNFAEPVRPHLLHQVFLI